ncbi:MAG: hypothetical protein N2489_05160 [Clostridia bacterium]|nr:hypothetical protein [Clostridia bacterium]
MAVKKKELIMLAVLGFLLYVLAFVKLVWQPVIPKINDRKTEITSLEKQIAQLQAELKNISVKKEAIKVAKAKNEKLEEYLFDTAGISDGVEMVDKLVKMLGKEIKGISISSPNKRVVSMASNGQPASEYYEFSLGLSSVLTMEEAMELLSYCEKGTRKITVSKFEMVPAAKNEKEGVQKQGTAEQKTEASKDLSYNVKMSLSFYSMDIGNANKMYDYTKGRFKLYEENNPNPFIDPGNVKDGKLLLPDIASSEDRAKKNLLSTYNSDLVISCTGFLLASDNYNIFSTSELDKRIRLTSKERLNVKISLSGSGYSIEAYDTRGNGSSFRGTLPARDFQLFIESKVSNAKDNQNIALNVKIINDSDRGVGIKLSDLNGKVSITDRNGKKLYIKNEQEKAYLL